MKDAVPRYWTMRGFNVPRKWGWDCHGLPIENIAEKELGFRHKKDIEEMGVDKFNEFCRSKVLKYASEWKVVIKRIGRWANMENPYKTMDLSFMESVWWVFKQLWDKGLIYEGHRTMHICTRCETTLSQSEVAEGYKIVKDLSVVIKFEITDKEFIEKYADGEKISFLAWTTTPWSLPTTMGLAIGENYDYLIAKINDERFIFVKERLNYILEKAKTDKYEVMNIIKGKNMAGISYLHPFFDFYKDDLEVKSNSNVYKTHITDYVSVEDGTGIVTINGAFGEIDMEAAKKIGLPIIVNVNMDGTFTEEMGEFAGLSVKPIDEIQSTDIKLIKYLANEGFLFAKEKHEHSYPHCWRCETPLINYSTSSWFVNIEKIKKEMFSNAKNINWVPAHLKEGRFGNWLEGARDWSISRQRFWASVIPIWKCECGEMKVVGSAKELEELSGEKITDIHKHVVDKITWKCEKCGKEMKRIPDVLDTWFDSGSMPYAQVHYPFEDGEKFDAGFPAEYIAEGVDQTRCWFYYLHVIATAIKKSHAFKNVIVNGIVLAEDGKKMSKRLQNYPDPSEIMEKYGADALRYYLLSSPVVSAETINFKESEVADIVRGMLRMLWNSYSFFVLYADIDKFQMPDKKDLKKSDSLLDKWILSELNILIKEINENMEKYELNKTVRLFPKFIDNLSNWYIRRSRKRFWKSENDEDKNRAYETLYIVLVELSKLMAPFMPFISDEIYRNLTGNESVHLKYFPKADESLIDEKLNEEMEIVRRIVSEGLQIRAKAGIKVRQPLADLRFKTYNLGREFLDIIKEEVNVKEAIFDEDIVGEISMNTEITEDLRLEGQAREIIRSIQEMRKEAGYEVDNRISVGYNGMEKVFERFGNLISKEVLANKIESEKLESPDLEKEFAVDDEKIIIGIKR